MLVNHQWDGCRLPDAESGPQAPPIGLGWWLFPVASTTVLHHGGGSPGGISDLSLVSEFDAVIAGFANGPGAHDLIERLHHAAIEDLTGNPGTAPDLGSPAPINPDVVGEYATATRRISVEVDGDELVLMDTLLAIDEEHRRVHEGHLGGALEPVSSRFRSVGLGQFAASAGGHDSDSTTSPAGLGVAGLLAALPAAPGRRPGLHGGIRYAPKIG